MCARVCVWTCLPANGEFFSSKAASDGSDESCGLAALINVVEKKKPKNICSRDQKASSNVESGRPPARAQSPTLLLALRTLWKLARRMWSTFSVVKVVETLNNPVGSQTAFGALKTLCPFVIPFFYIPCWFSLVKVPRLKCWPPHCLFWLAEEPDFI